MYHERAKALLNIVNKIKDKIKEAKESESYSDKHYVLIQAAHSLNTILYSFLIDQKIYESIDDCLNDIIRNAKTEEDVDVSLDHVDVLVAELKEKLEQKVSQYESGS